MEDIRIIFVIPEKSGKSSEQMTTAYQACEANANVKVSWLKESKFNNLTLNKTDFVVFDKFEGKLFEELKTTRCARIVGPLTVSICLVEGKKIPNFDWPIYNVAMYNCVVACSHLPKDVKIDIKTKVELMGGCYVGTLFKNTTHLIAGSAKTEKYLVAAETGLKLMCESWVEDVWRFSQSINVHADDEEFEKHRCLPFHNLIISSTGITNSIEKKQLEKMVNENGGKFTGRLNVNTTDILICSADAISSEKYKAARQNSEIKCVNISWVTDSIAKGYALATNLYQVRKITSTPTKGDRTNNPDFSVLSAIGNPNTSQRTWIEDSVFSPLEVSKVNSGKRKAKNDYEDVIENLNVNVAKRAGQFLDGCLVYHVGFNSTHTEKLNKIINLSGATRYDNFSDRITHVIVGDQSMHEVKLIKNKNSVAVMVSVHWLIASMEQGLPANEDKFLIVFENESFKGGSPLSKKGLSLLRASRMATENEVNSNVEGEQMDVEQIEHENSVPSFNNESDTLCKLLQEGNSNVAEQIEKIDEPPKATPDFRPSETSTQQGSISITQDESEAIKVFQNIKFIILGFEEEETDSLKDSIVEQGGDVLPKSYKGIPDYVIVPIFYQKEFHHTASEVVNNLFVSDCIREGELILNLNYYHRPFSLPVSDSKPVRNCVITTSGYSGMERTFLSNLIEALGGISQEQFSRVRSEAKNLHANTHLMSSEASGRKYEAALKWDLPVITKDWLLDCAKDGKKIHEANYLVGNSKAPCRSEDMVENININAIRRTENVFDSPGPSESTKVSTPASTPATPYHKRFLNSADKFSQVTPVNKIMKQFRESNLNSTVTVKETKEYTLPQPWEFVKTPNTPLGACLTPNPSPALRKQWEYWLQQFPDKGSPKSDKSTPLSEIKRQLWEKVGNVQGQRLTYTADESTKPQDKEQVTVDIAKSVSEGEKTPENQQLANKLQRLEDMLSASGSGKRRQSRNFQSTIPVPAGTSEFRDSQPCTVGWDYREAEIQKQRVFSLSGIPDDTARARMLQQLEELGGTVTSSPNYDPSCTHLLCPKASRNEKSLSCMAAGKWILHHSYLEKSMEAGHFLNEAEFEFGNPKSAAQIPVPNEREFELRTQMMHFWRNEVSRRGYGAFNDMRAIVVANKKEPIIRVIEAGGGVVVEAKPPFEDRVHATHCLLEPKSVKKLEDYIPLAKQGIYLVNTVYISDYLHNPKKDIRDCILPFFSGYYDRS